MIHSGFGIIKLLINPLKVLRTLSKNIFIPIGLTAAVSAIGPAIQKKMYWSSTTTLIIQMKKWRYNEH